MNLLDDLDAFVQEHKRCGLIESEVKRGEGECWAVISRTVETAPSALG